MQHKLSNFIISFMAIASLVCMPHPFVVGQTPQASVASDKSVAKIRAKVEKIGIRGDITVKMADRKSYHGFVTRIDDESFEVTDVDLKTTFTIRYNEVKSIENGYGEKGPLGNRVGKNKRRLGMLIGIAVAFILPVVIVAVVKDK